MKVSVCDRSERHENELVPAHTRSIGLDGDLLEIDLCDGCEKELADAMSPWVEAARIPPTSSNGRTRRSGSRNVTRPAVTTEPPPSGWTSADLDRSQRKEVRDWANANGLEVGPRGAIAQKIVDSYFAAVGSPA